MNHPDDNQEWRPVVGFEENYSISRTGLVRRTRSANGTPVWKPIKAYITDTVGKDYYFHILCVKNKTKFLRLHRMVFEAFSGPIPKGMQINHKNGIKTDNRLENLEAVTPSENTLHAFRVLGRTPVTSHFNRGEKSPRALLTNAQAGEIRLACKARSATHKQLSDKYGVSVSTIGRIAYGKAYY